MALNTLASDWMINNMAVAKKIGQMELNIPDHMLMDKSIKAFFHGLMAQNMKVIFMRTRFMGEALIYGLMDDHTLVIGNLTKCMVKENSNGQMAKNIKATIMRIKNTDMGVLNGLMEESIVVNGRTENNMEKVLL